MWPGTKCCCLSRAATSNRKAREADNRGCCQRDRARLWNRAEVLKLVDAEAVDVGVLDAGELDLEVVDRAERREVPLERPCVNRRRFAAEDRADFRCEQLRVRGGQCLGAAVVVQRRENVVVERVAKDFRRFDLEHDVGEIRDQRAAADAECARSRLGRGRPAGVVR